MKNSELKSIAISNLIAHPSNPNAMSEEKFRKLVRNIERTGLYEPLVVRPHPQMKNRFQIINGHHRVKALEKLGKIEADCVVWNVDDEQTTVLLTTLNRLCGADVLEKKIDLLQTLKERFDSAALARLIPQTRKQIEQLTNLRHNLPPVKSPDVSFAVPLVFFVTKSQQEIIESALSSIERQISSIETRSKATSPLRNQVSSNETTKSRRRAAALTQIAEQFITESTLK